MCVDGLICVDTYYINIKKSCMRYGFNEIRYISTITIAAYNGWYIFKLEYLRSHSRKIMLMMWSENFQISSKVEIFMFLSKKWDPEIC